MDEFTAVADRYRQRRAENRPILEPPSRFLLKAINYRLIRQDQEATEREYAELHPTETDVYGMAVAAQPAGQLMPGAGPAAPEKPGGPFTIPPLSQQELPLFEPGISQEIEHVTPEMRKAYPWLTPKYIQERPTPLTQQAGAVISDVIDKATPDVVKLAYNRSLTGVAHEMLFGEQAFDLSDYEPGVIADLTSSLLSLIMPVDAASFVVGGRVGKVVGQTFAPAIIRKLVANGVEKKVATWAAATATQAMKSGSALATYEAARPFISGGETAEIGKGALRGGALGFVLGTTGGVTAGMPLPARLGSEIAAFGGMSATLEGRAPGIDDFLQAAGFVLGLKLQGKITGTLKRRTAEWLYSKVEDEGLTLKEAMEAFATEEEPVREVQEAAKPQAPPAPVKAPQAGKPVKPPKPARPGRPAPKPRPAEPAKAEEAEPGYDETFWTAQKDGTYDKVKGKPVEIWPGHSTFVFSKDGLYRVTEASTGLRIGEPQRTEGEAIKDAMVTVEMAGGPDAITKATKKWFGSLTATEEGTKGAKQPKPKPTPAKPPTKAEEKVPEVPVVDVDGISVEEPVAEATRALVDAGVKTLSSGFHRDFSKEFNDAEPSWAIVVDGRLDPALAEAIKEVDGISVKPRQTTSGETVTDIILDRSRADETDPEAAREVFDKLAGWIRLIDDHRRQHPMGQPKYIPDEIERPAEQEATPEKPPERPVPERPTEEAQKPAAQPVAPEAGGKPGNLIDHFHQVIRDGRMPKAPAEVITRAREFDPELKADRDNDKIYDSLEAAVAREYHERIRGVDAFEDRLRIAQEIEKSLPTRRRTLEASSLARQQFSTPLTLAEGMFQAAKVRPGERVFEPTAGTGNLIAPVADWGRVVANELHRDRYEILDNLMGGRGVTQLDYLEAGEFPPSGVVLTNPPWGTASRSALAKANRLPDLAASFINKNLRELAPGGRLVALLPTTLLPGESADPWLSKVAKYHTVRAVIMSPPGAYGKGRGTDVTSFTLVVDKVDPNKRSDVSLPVVNVFQVQKGDKLALKDIGETVRLLKVFLGEPQTMEGYGLAGKRTWDAWRQAIDKIADRADIKEKGGADVTEGPQGPTKVPGVRGEIRRPTPAPGVRPGGPSGVSKPPLAATPAPKPIRSEAPAQTEVVSGEPETVPVAVGKAPREPRKVKRVERGRAGDVDSPIFTRFVPDYPGRSGSNHPRIIVTTKGAVSAGVPDVSDVKVGKAVRRLNKTGKISDEQLEFVVRGEATLDAGSGFLHAHDVGVGKTRVAMGHVEEWFEAGKANRVLYITSNQQNVKKVIKEWADLHDGKFPYRIVDIREEFPDASDARKAKDVDIPGFDKTVYFVNADRYRNFHDKIMDLGIDALIGDECHKFRNPGSARGALWVALHKALLNRKARIVYMSATPGRDIEEMGYLYGLREWGVGEFDIWKRKVHGEQVTLGDVKAAFDEFESVVSGKLQIGAKRQTSEFHPKEAEQVVRELVAKGKMLTTDLWRQGVEFNVVEKPLTRDESVTVDDAMTLLREAEQLFHEYKDENETIKNIFGPASGIQSLAKELHFNMRLRRAIEEAKQALARGEQPVISLIRVSGEEVGEVAAEAELDVKTGLPKTLTNIIEMINTRVVEVTDEGEQIDHGAIDEAVVAKQAMYEKAHQVWPKLPHPIEQLKGAFGENDLAVITGTYTYVAHDEAGRPIIRRRNVKPQDRIIHNAQFQTGKRKVMVLSGAGKTGIDAHDVNGVRRHMIETDPEWGADTFKQALGRVDRSGQKSSPKISFVTLGLAGERKFIGTIANRMRDLGATAKGAARSTGTESLGTFEYGDALSYHSLRETWDVMSREQRMFFTNLTAFRDQYGQPRDELQDVSYNTLQQFWRTIQTVPLEQAQAIQKLYDETHLQLEVESAKSELNRLRREGLSEPEIAKYLDDIEAGKSWKTIRRERHETGGLLREAELTDKLFLHEVQGKDGHRYGIVSGLITDSLADLIPFLGRKPNGKPDIVYQDFSFDEGGGVAGLRIPYMRIKPLAEAFKAEGFGTKVTLDTLREALGAGDKIDLANGWTIHLGRSGDREGRCVVSGPKMVDVVEEVGGEKRLKYGLKYHPTGFYYVEDPAEFARKFGLKAAAPKGDVVNPNIQEMHGGLGAALPGRNARFAQMLRQAISEKDRDREKLPTVMFEPEAKDVGLRKWFLTPSFVLGAIPGMEPKFGRPAQSAMRSLLLTERTIKVETAQRDEFLDKTIRQIPTADWGKVGERFREIFEGQKINAILARTDISEKTREAAKSLREFFDNDRKERIQIARDRWRSAVRRRVEKEYRVENGLQRKRLHPEHVKAIEKLTETGLDQIMPRDWGIDDYLPHFFPGDYRVIAEYADGTSEFVTSGKNKMDALAKIAEDYVDRNEIKPVVSYRVNKRLFMDPDVTRVSRPRYRAIVKDLHEAAEVSREEVQAAMRGRIGAKESRQKHFFAFKKRQGYLGYSKNLRETLTVYNRGYNRWKYLTPLNEQIQPLLRKIGGEGRPNTRAYVENIFNQLWGYQTDASRAVDAFLQKVPYIRDRTTPMALDRWLAIAKSGAFTGLLKLNPRFHLLNRMQTFQTLAPLVGVADFAEGRRSYHSAEGKELLRKHGVRYLTGGKLAEVGAGTRRAELREKFHGFAPETYNQEIAFLTMYEVARKRGLSDKEAADYAFLRGNVFSQFCFLKTDRPLFTRGPILSTMFMFKRFPIKDLELGYTLLRHSEYPGFAKWLGAHLLLGGTKSFQDFYGAPLKAIGKAYVPYSIYKAIREEDETLADVVAFGLPGLLGMDLSYSVDLLDVPFGKTLDEKVLNLVMGPIGNITYRAFKDAANTKGVVESPMERGIRSVVQRVPGLRWMIALEQLVQGADEGKYDFRSATGKLRFQGDLREVLMTAVGARMTKLGWQDIKFDALSDLAAQRDEIMDKVVMQWINSGEYPQDSESKERWNEMWPEWPISYKGLKARKKAREKSAQRPTEERVLSEGAKKLEEVL